MALLPPNLQMRVPDIIDKAVITIEVFDTKSHTLSTLGLPQPTLKIIWISYRYGNALERLQHYTNKSNSILFECDQERMQVLRGLAPIQVGDPSLRKIR